jgi:hypothetical protein
MVFNMKLNIYLCSHVNNYFCILPYLYITILLPYITIICIIILHVPLSIITLLNILNIYLKKYIEINLS